jgi:PAS domain S-box-containing protein
MHRLPEARLEPRPASTFARIADAVRRLLFAGRPHERDDSDERMREQQEQLQIAINNMSQGLLLFDKSGRLVMCNRQYLEMYRLSPETVRPGCTVQDLITLRRGATAFSGSVEDYCADLQASLRQGGIFSRLTELPDGRSIQIINQSVSTGGWVSTHEDITEFKRREASFRLLFDGNPVPMWVYEHGTMRFIAVNEAAIRHYGYTRDQFLAMSLLDVRPPEDREELRRQAQFPREPYRSGRMRRHIKADGTLIEVCVFAQSLVYEGRAASIGALVDLTDQRRAEQDRDRNRQFLDRVIENVPATIFVKDMLGRYVLVNRSAEKLWGLTRDQIIGRTADDIFPGRTADAMREIDQGLATTEGEGFFEEHPIDTPANGTRWVASRRLCIRGPSGSPEYSLGVVEDVTERRAVEHQLRQAQKMEAVGNLTGGLAHDFNNLLLIMIGNLDLLSTDIVDNPGAAETVETVMQAALRGAELTRQMLAFSRRQPLQPSRLDVNELAGNTIKMLARTIGENVDIQLRAVARLPHVFIDAAQLEAALVNIAINARDAMPNGGKLIVETKAAEFESRDSGLHPDMSPGPYVVISVTDTGSGMPPDVLARIFEPFFTTKENGRGTGLGLSMVYGFLKQSGGHITAYSEVGTGTVFNLYVPAVPETDQGATVKRTGDDVSPAPGHEVVLAVDDNADVRTAVVSQLTDLGYQVVAAENGEAALRKLESGIAVDLLFTDVIMPGGMNGKELAKRALEMRPDLKVLFTSGFPGTARSSGLDLEPGDALLGKPYRKRDLAQRVRRILDA